MQTSLLLYLARQSHNSFNPFVKEEKRKSAKVFHDALVAFAERRIITMKTMEGNYDSIQFETRAEIGEVIQALKEWKDVHKNDSKMETIQELIDRLDIISMSW